ncbi:MAG: sigma-70 family RNA polymerase sigma factor [Planctomycetota bacterium]
MSFSDEEIVRKCQADPSPNVTSGGQKQYFQELINRYTRLVFGVAYTLVRDYQAAEDITQETWLRAYDGLHKCTEPSGFSRWLVTITRNCAYEWLRKMKQRTVVNTEVVNKFASDQSVESVFRQGGPPLAVNLCNQPGAPAPELIKTLLGKIADLSDDQRVVLSLKHQKGMKCEEIAEALGMPIGTVTSTLSRAYRKLRENWKNGMME